MNKEQILSFILTKYGATPQYLWQKYPNYCVLRHGEKGKWFAVIMEIPKSKLGLSGEETAVIADVKCGPVLMGSYIGKKGVFPAYHMNKTHWLTLLLESADEEDIKELLDVSFHLTE